MRRDPEDDNLYTAEEEFKDYVGGLEECGIHSKMKKNNMFLF